VDSALACALAPTDFSTFGDWVWGPRVTLTRVRFVATLDIDLPADVIEHAPTFWDRCKGLTGTAVDLSTDRVRSRIEASTFLYQVRSALVALGIDNARWLVVDGTPVFEDHKGVPNDLPELMTAFADHVLLQTQAIRQLRLCVEHEEAGLGVEIEARMAAEHPRDEPAARVSITGRILDLGPRHDESGGAYRRRIEQIVSDAARWAAVKVQFSTFVSRFEQALGVALPGASVQSTTRQLGFELQGEPSLWPESSKRGLSTASPQRNFTLSLEQRIAAAIGGPPAYAVRLRKIEALEAHLVNQLAMAERQSLDIVPAVVTRGLDELNRLIDQHNRYYPIERNLAMDPSTGALLAVGEPWTPLGAVSIQELRHRTAAMRAGRQE